MTFYVWKKWPTQICGAGDSDTDSLHFSCDSTDFEEVDIANKSSNIVPYQFEPYASYSPSDDHNSDSEDDISRVVSNPIVLVSPVFHIT